MFGNDPFSHLRATQNLRASMGSNPYHNQHIAEFTACMDEAMKLHIQYENAIFSATSERLDAIEKRIEALEEGQKQPAQFKADVQLNEKSARNLRKKLMDLLKW